VHDLSYEYPRARLVRVAKGRPIFEQGGPAHPPYVIEKGCVSLSTTEPGGRRVVITFLYSGDTLCAGVNDTWASAVAVTDCQLSRMPAASASLQSGGALLDTSDQMLREVVTRFALLAHLDAPAQVRWFFDWLALRTGRLPGQALDVPMSRRDIADFLAVAPETVSRAMRTLEERGELRREGLHACRLPFERRRGLAEAIDGGRGSLRA
jgi:CRP/FNR family transcriptional regulator